MLYGYIKNEEFNNFDNVGIKAIDDSTIRFFIFNKFVWTISFVISNFFRSIISWPFISILFTDGKHEGQFQMTRVKTTIVEDHQTAVGMFEKGQ